jgi:hypothetical protein
MSKITDQEIFEIWNEAEELVTSLKELTNAELIECRVSLLLRACAILNLSEDYV